MPGEVVGSWGLSRKVVLQWHGSHLWVCGLPVPPEKMPSLCQVRQLDHDLLQPQKPTVPFFDT